MKKTNYIIAGIVVLVIIIAIAGIYVMSKKETTDYDPLYLKNDSNTNLSGNSVNIIANNSETINPSVSDISGNYSILLKVKNPQYKQGSEIFFIYEIRNLDNSSLIIPKNINYGIEIKNSDGSAAQNYDSSDKLVMLKEDLNIPTLSVKSSEFSIKGDDFGFSGLNPTEGSYYAVIINIGNVKSNKAMVRILK